MWQMIWQMCSLHTHQKDRSESVSIHLRWTAVHIYGIAPELSKLSSLCYNIAQNDLDHLDILQNITLVTVSVTLAMSINRQTH